VQSVPAVRRQRLLDRHPGQLVAEPDAALPRYENAGGQALLQPDGRISDERVEQPQLGLRQGDRDRFDDRRGGVAQSGGTR
jgi:hypothetical protein